MVPPGTRWLREVGMISSLLGLLSRDNFNHRNIEYFKYMVFCANEKFVLFLESRIRREIGQKGNKCIAIKKSPSY